MLSFRADLKSTLFYMRRIHRPHRRALDVEMSTISFMSARVSLFPLRFSVLPDFVPCAAVSRSTGPASRPWITERKLGRIGPGEPHLKITIVDEEGSDRQVRQHIRVHVVADSYRDGQAST